MREIFSTSDIKYINITPSIFIHTFIECVYGCSVHGTPKRKRNREGERESEKKKVYCTAFTVSYDTLTRKTSINFAPLKEL